MTHAPKKMRRKWRRSDRARLGFRMRRWRLLLTLVEACAVLVDPIARLLDKPSPLAIGLLEVALHLGGA